MRMHPVWHNTIEGLQEELLLFGKMYHGEFAKLITSAWDVAWQTPDPVKDHLHLLWRRGQEDQIFYQD